MAVRVTQVRYSADTKAATGSVKTVERELDILTAKANRSIAASRAAKNEAAGISTFGSNFKAGRSKVEFGPFEVGSKGFQANAGFMRGMAGRAVTIGLANRVIAGGLNNYQDIKEKLEDFDKRGYTSGEKALAIAGEVEKSTISFLSQIFGVKDLSDAVLRRAGYTEQGRNRLFEAMEDTFDNFYDPKALQGRQKARTEAQWAKEEATWKAWSKSVGELNTMLPKTFRLRSPGDVRVYRNEIKNGKIAAAGGISNSEFLDNERETMLRLLRLNPSEGR